MHISAIVQTNIHILFRLFFSLEFVTFGCYKGRGVKTKNDKVRHAGGGVIRDILFEWGLKWKIHFAP